MHRLFQLQPEVAGELGDETVFSRKGSWVAERLHYDFDGWSGDDLLEAVGNFIVTNRLRTALETSDLSGFSFDNATVTCSDTFRELMPRTVLPRFYWLKIHGVMGVDDFSAGPRGELVVTERAVEVLRRYSLFFAGVSSWPVTPSSGGAVVDQISPIQRFQVLGIDDLDGTIRIIGRCLDGPIRIGHEFVKAYRSGHPSAPGPDERSIRLQVDRIEAYGRDLDHVTALMGARITVSGEGAELIRLYDLLET